MKYLFKLALIPFVYLLFMLLIGFMAFAIPDNLMWLKYIAAAACLGIYGYIVFGVMFREGETALKVRIANDLERKNIIDTGEDRPLNVSAEYKPWKGFVAGLVVCMPLLILMLIHTVLIFSVGINATGAGSAAGIIYFMIYSFFIAGGAVLPLAYNYYLALVALPLIVGLMGLAYMLGARKIMRQQENLKEIEDSIYGEKGEDN